MKLIFLRNVVLFIGLLAFLSSGQAGAQGYIWCFGDNDHSELEIPASAACGSTSIENSLPAHEEAQKIHAKDEHANPCVDVPPSVEADSRRTKDHKTLQAKKLLPAVVQIHALPTFSQALITKHFSQPPPRISQALLAQRTIVLLH